MSILWSKKFRGGVRIPWIPSSDTALPVGILSYRLRTTVLQKNISSATECIQFQNTIVMDYTSNCIVLKDENKNTNVLLVHGEYFLCCGNDTLPVMSNWIVPGLHVKRYLCQEILNFSRYDLFWKNSILATSILY